MTYWLELDKAQDVAAAAADAIEEHARLSIQSRGEFKLVLAGGTTPRDCYQLLADRSLEWDKWKLFYGDERCLPENHVERNHQMVLQTGLASHVAEHFVIQANLGPKKGAMLYQDIIRQYLPFDMVLLGIGEDGHTASLFPDLDWKQQDPEILVMPVYGAPKPPPQRISLTLSALQNSLQMLVLITGENKRDAVRLWKQGVSLPVSELADCEQCAVYVEKAVLK